MRGTLAALVIALAACYGGASVQPPAQAGGEGGSAPAGGSGGAGGCGGICPCDPGETRPCWPGAAEARGIGECSDGRQTCLAGDTWSACEGAQGPRPEAPGCDGLDMSCDGADGPACGTGCTRGGVEICGDGLDDDCSGAIDEHASCYLSCYLDGDGPLPAGLACCAAGAPPCERQDCDDRTDQPCYSGPLVTLGVGACHGGRASCVADGFGQKAWGTCRGEVLPGRETCGNGIDDDCDGFIDESDGATGARCPRPACADGRIPTPERCGDGVDSDCDGRGAPGEPEDAGCCTPAGPEVCNGLDDDCDGLVDEGVVNHCGRCSGPCFGATSADLPADGSWTVDSHSLRSTWRTLSFAATTPAGTSVEVTVRFGDTRAETEAAAACVVPASGGELSACASRPYRFALVHVRLIPSGTSRPSVRHIVITWDR